MEDQIFMDFKKGNSRGLAMEVENFFVDAFSYMMTIVGIWIIFLRVCEKFQG